MRKCIPDELFNRVAMPTGSVNDVPVGRFAESIRYKVPIATDTLVKRETWAAVCDFCERVGALVEKQDFTITKAQHSVIAAPIHGEFQRLVGVSMDDHQLPISEISIDPDSYEVRLPEPADEAGHSGWILFTVVPNISDMTVDGNGVWNPVVPDWFFHKYEKAITNGALFRIYGMLGKPWSDQAMARMNAVSYNSEIERCSVGLLTSGMRRQIKIDIEDVFVRPVEGK